MHEIDVGVGLEKIAPRALARVRLAGDEQHFQLVAHALDGDDGLVVERREFVGQGRPLRVRRRCGPPCSTRTTARASAPARARVRPTSCPSRRMTSSIGSPRSPVSCTRTTMVWSRPTRPKRGASTSSMRRSRSPSRPVMKRMHRRAEAELVGAERNVVHDAVGDEDGAADAFGRHVGERGRRAPENSCVPSSWPALAPASTMRISMLSMPSRRLSHLRARGVRLRRAVGDGLAGAAVDDDGDDVLQRLAIFAHERRISEREQDEREAERADPRAAPAAPHAERGDGDRAERAGPAGAARAAAAKARC